MKNMVKASVMAAALAASVLAAGAAAAPLKIDPAKSVIVSSGQRPADHAAQELQYHFKLITGVEVPIVKAADAVPADAYPWYVGCMKPTSAPDKLKPEQSIYEITPKAASFWGEGRAPEMAVYRFLERALGIRWPWANAVAYDASKTIDVADRFDDWTPELRIRGIRGSGRDFVEWRFRLLSGGHERPNFGHAFTEYWGRFGANQKHTEYFAMRKDGKRMPVGVTDDTAFNIAASKDRPARFISICPSSTALVAQIVADWKAKGCRGNLNICENDAAGENICHCEACRLLDEPPPADAWSWWHNWYADRYVVLAKRVLEAAKQVRPDAQVAMYAYNATEQAPRREKLNPDIIVGMVPTLFSRKAITDYYARWKNAGCTAHFYRPNRRCYFNAPFLPLGYDRHFFDVFKLVYSFGSMGYDYDGVRAASPFGWFADYVILKGMSEPERSFEYWEDHYFKAFGAAAEDVKAYYRYWREVWETRIAPDVDMLTELGLCFNFTRGLYWNLEKYMSDADFVKSGCLLHRALSHEELDANRRGFVEKLLASHEHSRRFAAACATMTEDAAYALLDYRQRNGFNMFQYGETYFGDVCATGRAATNGYARMEAPLSRLKIVDAYGFSEEAAELKRHLDRLAGGDVALVHDEAAVKPGDIAFYVGRVHHGMSQDIVDSMPPRRGIWGWSKDRGVYFYGPKLGLKSAINEFLENELWVRWPWGDESALKPKTDGMVKIYDKAGSWAPNPQFGRRSFRIPGESAKTFLRRMQFDPGDAELPLRGKQAFKRHIPLDGRLHGDEGTLFEEFRTAFKAGQADFEYTADEPKTPFDWYRVYLICKAFQDPAKPLNFWEKRYFQAYGAAAGEMRAYFSYLAGLGGRRPTAAEAAEAKRLHARALARNDLSADDRSRVEKAAPL